jgi:hypothetical protein
MKYERYERADYGPGDIAALPPTIGMTSRAPTIGAADRGRPIPSVLDSMGNNGANGGSNRWLLPIGIGLAAAGLIFLAK